MPIVRMTLDPDNPPRLTDEEKARLDAMTEDEIEAAALSDPDNPPSTDEQLATAFRPGSLRALRERLGLSQAAFAERYGINLRTLQDWEQFRRVPDQVARSYLRVIAADPEGTARALAAA